MIGQKRRQSTNAANGDQAVRSRAVSVSADSTSSASDDDRGALFFRHLPRSSWFCRKFWKSNKNNSANTNANANANESESNGQTSESSSNNSSSSTSDFVQRQRRRYRRFYKSVIKRSRTTDNYERRNLSNQGESSNDYDVATEEEWKRLEASIARLLERLNDQTDDGPAFPDEECVICVTGRASMQTFPCGHKVLCKTCFVRTIQVALQDRQLPLRCVVCRSRIVRLKQQPAPCRVVLKKQREPPGSFYMPPAPSPLPPSGIRHPGYM